MICCFVFRSIKRSKQQVLFRICILKSPIPPYLRHRSRESRAPVPPPWPPAKSTTTAIHRRPSKQTKRYDSVGDDDEDDVNQTLDSYSLECNGSCCWLLVVRTEYGIRDCRTVTSLPRTNPPPKTQGVRCRYVCSSSLVTLCQVSNYRS